MIDNEFDFNKQMDEIDNINDAILDGFREEFSDDNDVKFERENRPITCYYKDKLICQIRIDLIKNTIEIWASDILYRSILRFHIKKLSEYKDSTPLALCSPYKSWQFESGRSFEDAFKTLRFLISKYKNASVA